MRDILDLLDIPSDSESVNLSEENIQVQTEMNDPIFIQMIGEIMKT